MRRACLAPDAQRTFSETSRCATGYRPAKRHVWSGSGRSDVFVVGGAELVAQSGAEGGCCLQSGSC